MLCGDVKSVRHLRTYSEAYLRDNKDAPFSNFAHQYNFSEEGDLTAVTQYDGNSNKTAEYTFARQGNNVKASATTHTFHARYVRDISNFEISYSGDWSRDDGSAGSIGQIKTLSSPHHLLEKEAVRIVRKMPKWTPGKQNGRPVRTWFTIPVNFTLN